MSSAGDRWRGREGWEALNDRTILLADCGSGLAIAVLGALATTPETIGRAWWLVVVTGLLTGVATYVDEQRLEGRDWRARLTFYGAAAGVLAALLAGVVAATSLGPSVALTVAVVGFGLATVVNRLVYGVVYPVPQRRLERAERYSL